MKKIRTLVAWGVKGIALYKGTWGTFYDGRKVLYLNQSMGRMGNKSMHLRFMRLDVRPFF